MSIAESAAELEQYYDRNAVPKVDPATLANKVLRPAVSQHGLPAPHMAGGGSRLRAERPGRAAHSGPALLGRLTQLGLSDRRLRAAPPRETRAPPHAARTLAADVPGVHG